jgi:hypothetical protein
MLFRPRSFAFAAALCVALIPYGCSQSPTSASSEKAPSTSNGDKKDFIPATLTKAAPASPKLPVRREADDVARFLSGLPGNPDSPFAELENKWEWKSHKKYLDQAWDRANKVLLSGLSEFHKTELTDPKIDDAAVFYPFSGPDTLFVTYAFPKSPTYVLVGLEPPGTLPTFAHIQKQLDGKKTDDKKSQEKNSDDKKPADAKAGSTMASYLADVRETVASVLGRSFFITKQMDSQFRGQVSDGLMVPIIELLVRSNMTISGYRYIRLDDNGEVIDRDLSKPASSNRGIEIEFTDSDKNLHTLYYFSMNLADERFKNNKPFQAFMANMKGFSAAFKATSYMTHHVEFSAIRQLVLDNANTILQDDSGIPFKNYKPDTWKVQLYGKYVQPFGVFKYWSEADLAEAYTKPDVKALPFRIGYGYSVIPSNELVARRIQPIAK